MEQNNILIGYEAGVNLTTEKYKLIVKSASIDMDETMSEREYELISKVLTGVMENFNKQICDCSKYTTGNCSTVIGRPALGCKDICVKMDNLKNEKMDKIVDPNGILDQASMGMDAEKGHKVTVTEITIKNGYDSDKEHAEKFLKVGEIYTVEKMEAFGWSSVVTLQEFPNIEFNTVHFIDAE